jgi:hypothetical protein
MNLKVFIGACVLSGLVACSSVKQDEAGLSRPGVSLELAHFRKEHFSNVRYKSLLLGSRNLVTRRSGEKWKLPCD